MRCYRKTSDVDRRCEPHQGQQRNEDIMCSCTTKGTQFGAGLTHGRAQPKPFRCVTLPEEIYTVRDGLEAFVNTCDLLSLPRGTGHATGRQMADAAPLSPPRLRASTRTRHLTIEQARPTSMTHKHDYSSPRVSWKQLQEH